MIEAGADMVTTTGVPALGAVEIYRSAAGPPRPILYGMGRLCYSPDAVLRSERPDDDDSLIVRTRIDGLRVTLEIYPIDLKAAQGPAGVPRLADMAHAREILDRLQRLSEPFHTLIRTEPYGSTVRGVIVVERKRWPCREQGPVRRALFAGVGVSALMAVSSGLARPASVAAHANEFALVAVGDMVISRPLSMLQNPGALGDPRPFADAVALLRQSDAAYGNLETVIIDIRNFTGAPYSWDGDWPLSSVPDVAQDLASMHLNLVSRANNHALDWGLEGLRECGRRVAAAGIAQAGVGEDSSQAAAPGLLSERQGHDCPRVDGLDLQANHQRLARQRGRASGPTGR